VDLTTLSGTPIIIDAAKFPRVVRPARADDRCSNPLSRKGSISWYTCLATQGILLSVLLCSWSTEYSEYVEYMPAVCNFLAMDFSHVRIEAIIIIHL
jgi:hypothetical protein